ncbi:hypothetical protein [Streptomyces coriariae]|uniref:hypothetical protein n=1 Tax=Streptomyces coriariae TaxID=2864460 RepID=UPI001E398B43|nr:hypothetical protein [Streptomyces coriariae]
MAVVADIAGTDREVSGRHGQAIFASRGGLALVEELPDPPAHDATGFSPLPDVLPLAVQRAPDIPYAAATVHRAAHPETGAPEEMEVGFLEGEDAEGLRVCGRQGDLCRLRAGPQPHGQVDWRVEQQRACLNALQRGHNRCQEPSGAALIRALVRTGAELVVVPREELPLEDAVGVLLRYPDPGVPL